jgi:hypothetical protein
MRTLLQKTQTEVFPSRTPIPWSSSRIVSLDWTGVSATDPSSLTFQDVNVSPVCAGPPEPDSLLTCQSKMSELGDLRSVVKPSDFYSVRQWHSTSMYSDYHRPHGLEHELQLCLPDSAGLSAGPGRNVRLYLYRSPGPDFSERDRAVLTLLRPHLHQAFWMPSGAAIRYPGSPRGRRTCCTCWPPGTPTPRSPAALAYLREPCAPTWKTSTAG